jgi:hypothetical protein
MSTWVAALAPLGALFAAGLVWRRARRRRPLQVGRRGLRHRDLGWTWILWDEIEGAYPPPVDHDEAIRLRLRLTPRLRRALGARGPTGAESLEVRLDLAGAPVHATDLLLLILERGADARPGSAAAPRTAAVLDGSQAPY